MEKEVIIPNEKFNLKDYNFFVNAVDVGASHTYIAIMGVKEKRDYEIIFKHSYETNEISDLSKIINHALFEAKELYNIEVNRCCIGAAGPVSRRRGHMKLSHGNMNIVAKDILESTMLNKVILVNDFEAVGFGIDLLNKESDTRRIPPLGEDMMKGWIPGNTYAVLGAGAGLGMSILHYDFTRHVHIPLPSEGGHMDFAPKDDFEWELFKYLKANTQHDEDTQPEFENLLSGQGMDNIYKFLRSRGEGADSEIVKEIDGMEGKEKFQKIEDNYDNDETCKRTIDLLINFFARAARNLALISECYSGLYLSGRIANKNIDRFMDGKFMTEFLKSDKKTDVLMKVPVYIITNTELGLLGLCNIATNFYNIC